MSRDACDRVNFLEMCLSPNLILSQVGLSLVMAYDFPGTLTLDKLTRYSCKVYSRICTGYAQDQGGL